MNLPVRPIRKRCENYSRRNQFDRYFGKNHQHDRYGYPFFSSGSGPEYRYRPEYVRCIHIPQNMTKYSMFDLEHIRDL